MSIDWSDCHAVRMQPGYMSGAAALRCDHRVHAETVLVNMDAGMSAEQVVEMFGLKTPLKDVLAVYKCAKEQTWDGKPQRIAPP